jgi:hypothetical protein
MNLKCLLGFHWYKWVRYKQCRPKAVIAPMGYREVWATKPVCERCGQERDLWLPRFEYGAWISGGK